jgi:crotonobetainyl-CoA:carnitine CoA-transferase CaiB-like acyl-CoA transferase
MTDSVLAHAVVALTGVTDKGKASTRGSDRLSGGLPCYNVYRTRDERYLAVGALEKKFWETLCDTVRRPDLKASHIVFGEEAQATKDALAAIFATKPQQEWAAIFATADCCVSPILPMHDAVANEQLRARSMIVDASARTGPVTQFAPPLHMSEFEFAVERQAPRQGQHSEEILREAGYSAKDIAQFRDAGVI